MEAPRPQPAPIQNHQHHYHPPPSEPRPAERNEVAAPEEVAAPRQSPQPVRGAADSVTLHATGTMQSTSRSGGCVATAVPHAFVYGTGYARTEGEWDARRPTHEYVLIREWPAAAACSERKGRAETGGCKRAECELRAASRERFETGAKSAPRFPASGAPVAAPRTQREHFAVGGEPRLGEAQRRPGIRAAFRRASRAALKEHSKSSWSEPMRAASGGL